MRSVNADSAASPDGRKWDQIDWPTVHRRVRGLFVSPRQLVTRIGAG